MKKIIFIINTIPNQRCIKRINEFIDYGYEIDAYSFIRENSPYNQPTKFNIEIIGELKSSGGYKNRVRILTRGIQYVKSKYLNSENIVFYYFGLDIALFATFFIKKKYFYEESDLSQTYISNSLIKGLLNLLDKRIIKNSIESMFTSEGFLNYHFGKTIPENVSIIPNRVNKNCLLLEKKETYKLNIQNLKIGFVGLIRYKTILNFVECFAQNFPQHEFHFFGNAIDNKLELNNLKILPNVFFHGEFQNPSDLPAIYQSIDLVLSTYDIKVENARYAEPNKIYEAIFFHTPIIVSKNTFLSEKVEKLGIGYSIDAMNNDEINTFVNNITEEDVDLKIEKCKKLPLSYSVDDNKDFFEKIEKKIKSF